jgi:hypothetical protein
MENVATYSEARSEYTKQLATFIVPAMLSWFQMLWHRNSGNKSQCMALFQTECEEIGRWNTDRVHDEVRALIERSGCDYMEELMTAVFIAHTKVLTAVRLSTRKKKLSIQVPKLDHFIHRVFRETARSYWKAPYMFMESGNVVERQKNILQLEALATEAITTAVRGMLPVKDILHDYLEDDAEDVEDEELVGGGVAVPTNEVVPTIPGPTPSEIKKEEEQQKQETTEEEKVQESRVEAPAPAPTETSEAKPTNVEPDVFKIDTKPSVSFSDYDAEFSDSKVTMKYSPKIVTEEDHEIAEMSADDGLIIDDKSEVSLSELDDIENLDMPPKPVMKITPDEDDLGDIEILE